jgi:hypothetical protein
LITCKGTTLSSKSISVVDAAPFCALPSTELAIRAALVPVPEVIVLPLAALLDKALSESSKDTLKLLEMLLLFSVSDSEAAVDAEADLLSLAAALALSLELAR